MSRILKVGLDGRQVEPLAHTPRLVQQIVMVVLLAGALAVVGLEVRNGLEGSLLWYDGLAIAASALIILGVLRPQNRKPWVAVAADREGPYLCCSTDGGEYLLVPWKIVGRVTPSMEGVGRRGLDIEVDLSEIPIGDREGALAFARSTRQDADHAVLSVPAGVTGYPEIFARLEHLRPC